MKQRVHDILFKKALFKELRENITLIEAMRL